MNDVRFEVHNLLINGRAQSERQGNSFVPRARKTAKPHTKSQQRLPTPWFKVTQSISMLKFDLLWSLYLCVCG